MTLRHNRKAEEYLRRRGWATSSDSIVNDLIDGGFIEEDTPTVPTTNKKINSYDYASGLNTESWVFVFGKNYDKVKNDTQFMKDVLEATAILAKEAGIDL